MIKAVSRLGNAFDLGASSHEKKKNAETQSKSAEPSPPHPYPNRETHECGTDCFVCLRELVKSYDGVTAVDGVSFEMARGELLALLGPSGCGKTTTLRLLAGFERLDSGEIDIGCHTIASNDMHTAPERRKVGMVFQEYALFPHLDVAENVEFGLHRYGGDKRRRVGDVLDLVGLTDYAERMPHELSGGQQQRVALARALAPEPDLIVLDEPFSNLDATLRHHIRAEVRTILRQANATAIFVTHDQEEALSLVDKVAIMIAGRVHQVDTPFRLYKRPANKQVAEFVGDANFVGGIARGKEVTCELGQLASLSDAQGQVDVLVRPEDIIIRPAPPDAPNRVRDIVFYGHDQLVTVELPSSSRVNARILGPYQQFAIGQPVNVNVTAPVMVYPR